MLSLIAIIALNISPIQNIHLETNEGKAQLTQKVEACALELEQKWNRVKELQKNLDETLIKLYRHRLETLNFDSKILSSDSGMESEANLNKVSKIEYSHQDSKDAEKKSKFQADGGIAKMTKEDEKWQATMAQAEMAAIQWQAATQEIPELKAVVDAGIKGIEQSAHIVNLVSSFEKGDSLSQENQELLQRIAAICQRN